MRTTSNDREQLLDHILMIDRRFYRILQAGGARNWADVDLTMPQLKTLLLIWGDPDLTMTRLARTIGVSLPTATGIVDRLVAQGMVDRVDDPDDRRLVLLRLTEAGGDLLERLREANRARLRLVLDQLSLEDLRVVARALDVLYDAALALAESESLSAAGS